VSEREKAVPSSPQYESAPADIYIKDRTPIPADRSKTALEPPRPSGKSGGTLVMVVIGLVVVVGIGTAVAILGNKEKDVAVPLAPPAALPSPIPEPSTEPSPIPEPSIEPSPIPEPSIEPSPIPEPSIEPSPIPEPAPVVKAFPAISPARLANGRNLGEACESYYPSASRRLSEEGSVVILFRVLVNGHVGETKIETSSGYPRLDEATAKCLTSQGRFEPDKVGNEVHESWQRLTYTWRLRD